MKIRLILPTLLVVVSAFLLAQQPGSVQERASSDPQSGKPAVALPAEPPDAPVEFVCPMDPDVRSSQPGKCPRCGMKLVAGIPEMLEYQVALTTEPKALKAGAPVELRFDITNPKDHKRVKDYEIMHEKLFHMFIVSQDLSFFVHDHPIKGDDAMFRLKTELPKPGLYRILSDFYPKGGTPQLIANTVIVPGAPFDPHTTLKPDVGVQKGANMDVSLVTEPAVPIAGMKTLMFFKLSTADGFEPYIGAWGHMLAASEDLVDMIHNHPFIADGGPNVQFNMIFPRPGIYRVWVQFQRKGVVNTLAYNIPVVELK
ncbi:MAG: heavy metal-binding domain-containing protein [Bryobacteraceae bacterium]